MGIKSRTDLKSQFKNFSKPSERDFANLIDSMINKRDDAFMGKWKKGTVYRSGEVVIYKNALWTIPYGEDNKVLEICSREAPDISGHWQSLIIPTSDNDWETDEENGIMYAKVYGCIGIGRRFTEPLCYQPEAKVDIEEEDKARYLILPKKPEVPMLSLFQLGNSPIRSYLLTGLDSTHAGFTSNVPNGFFLRQGLHCDHGEEADLDFRTGNVLMVVQPAGEGLAKVGISTETPEAMLDITDRQKGQFLFNPDHKQDPAFTIVNLDPQTDKNYLASGVGKDWSAFVTDAPKGYTFKHGVPYGTYCAHGEINQGQSLMVVRPQAVNTGEIQPRVGIGTEEPCAMLDVTDQTKGRLIFRPEDKPDPLLNMIHLDAPGNPRYLASGVTDDRSEWMTNSPVGFAFKKGMNYADPCSETDLAEGESLLVILANGNVGMGVEDPPVSLEISDDRNSGRFLFNLDNFEDTPAPNPALSIVNTRPDDRNTFMTLGASNDNAVMLFNAPYGFSIRHTLISDPEDHELVNFENYSENLINLRPELEVGDSILPKQLSIFPEDKGQKTGEVFIRGKVGIARAPKNYSLDVKGTIRSAGLYLNTDNQKMVNVATLGNVIDKVKKLRPVSFEWDASTGLQQEGPQIGLVAHEVEDWFDEVVKITPDDVEGQTKSVAYQNLVPVLIKAIKEQQEMIDQLKQRLDNLEAS